MILVTLSYACTSSLSDALFGHLFSKMLLPPLESCHNQRTKCCFFSEIIELFTLSSSEEFKRSVSGLQKISLFKLCSLQ